MTDMMFVFSSWGSKSLDWLQHGACEGSCNKDTNLSTFSNIKIWTQGHTPEPLPPTEPVDPLQEFSYSSPCGDLMDQSLCSDGCDCHMSWPAIDAQKRRSPDAACRCLPKQMAPEAYTFMKECKENTWGACYGCENCQFSWPAWDTKLWQSPEKLCRCSSEQPTLTYSGETCPNLYDGHCGADCHSCVKATDDSTGQSGCYCAPGEIQQIVWGKLQAIYSDAVLCGDSCKECRWSWKETDALGSLGTTATYRCRDW